MLFTKPFRILGVIIGLGINLGLTWLFWPYAPAYGTAFLAVICLIQLLIDVFGPSKSPAQG